ncbi:antiviral helicase [Atractiella rhizophila]|nr:antiviral helicase [Atractiella rhizophila]
MLNIDKFLEEAFNTFTKSDKWQQVPSFLHVEPSFRTTTLEFKTKGLDGRACGFEEAKHSGTPLSAKATTSMTRPPADPSSFVRGKSTYMPFTPGGAEEIADLGSVENNTKTIPPGFTRGLDFPQVLSALDDKLEDGGRAMAVSIKASGNYKLTMISKPDPTPRSVLNKRHVVAKRDWAHVVDANTKLTNFHDLVPQMAREFPFELDDFQKEAIYHMEQGDSVFVAAHTSAGKTVVAEYAIALAEKHMTKAIYTSPIKALSNQKFRDFKRTFTASAVGIMTGDIQINTEGSCLIMTTEILRSMLYKGADLIRDVEWVIFDEVHYVNDLERGVVWEEVIIMLPDHVNVVLLSATVPNTKEFADWVGRTKKKDIFVISTTKRPVPLEHYLYAGREIHKIVDQRGEFLGQGWRDAVEGSRRKQDKEREGSVLSRAATPVRGGRGSHSRGGRAAVPAKHTGIGKEFRQDATLWVHMVGLLKKKQLLPAVIFAFSKKRCEEYAASMPNTDLCTASEKSEIHVVLERSLMRLQGSDKDLPQIKTIRLLLGRGIGVHHGGLLPIVKEMVELLFARGLVKILFATETFAMGVNMPARSVVFANTRKHDGKNFRDLLPGEYTQMAGRAGRRGLDATGVVIIVCEHETPDSPSLIKMLLGTPTRLSSQFRLTYNMVLNLLRVEALRVEEMIKRSFSENASQKLLPENQKQLEEARALTSLADYIRQYYDLSARIVDANRTMMENAFSHPFCAKIFNHGRVVILSDLVDLGRSSPTGPVWPPSLAEWRGKENLTYELDSVPLSSISFVTRFNFETFETTMLDDLAGEVQWSKHRSLDFLELLKLRNDLVTKRSCLTCQDDPYFEQLYRELHAEKEMEVKVANLKLSISEQNLELLPHYQQKVAVLRTLEFVDSNSTVLLKGRVACEINSANELILTELILDNVFGAFEPEEIVALLSPFIFQEKTEIDPILTKKLEEGRELIINTTRKIQSVCTSFGDEMPDNILRFGLMEVVYEWAKGMPFNQIASLTDVQEGTIVRTITRLDETCREIKDAARIVGNSELFAKMERAQLAIRRDVVFCASLYF